MEKKTVTRMGVRNQDNPGPIVEFGHCENQHYNGCQNRPEAVDNHFNGPLRIIAQYRAWFLNLHTGLQVADLPPAARHTGLGEGEGEKHANCV